MNFQESTSIVNGCTEKQKQKKNKLEIYWMHHVPTAYIYIYIYIYKHKIDVKSWLLHSSIWNHLSVWKKFAQAHFQMLSTNVFTNI